MADENTRTTRTPRDLISRESSKRRWAPPSLLPEPRPQEGYSFRWIRISTNGQVDANNISSKIREGYEPVRAVDHPELGLSAIDSGRFQGCVESGGLLLCKIPSDMVEQRNAYYQNHARMQEQALDENFMRENDPRMPLISERKSKVTFGSGN